MRIAILAAVFAQQGLNAPVDSHPTVGSEVRRGYEAGESCASYAAPPERLEPCIARVRDAYRIAHDNSDAYEAGLNLQQWIIGDRFVRAVDGDASRTAQEYRVFGQGAADRGKQQVVRLAGQLHIAVGDVAVAAGLTAEDLPH